MSKLWTIVLVSCAACAALSGAAQAGVPYAGPNTPAAVDRGELAANAAPLTVTVALSLPKLADAESLLQAVNTKGDAQYHKFLTADQFVARFAPTEGEVAKVVASLAKYGLAAERATANDAQSEWIRGGHRNAPSRSPCIATPFPRRAGTQATPIMLR